MILEDFGRTDLTFISRRMKPAQHKMRAKHASNWSSMK
jgi:hypothetical protein